MATLLRWLHALFYRRITFADALERLRRLS